MCHVETSAIHSGYTAADHVHAAVPPIYLSAAFHMESADRGDALSAGTQDGFSYSRVANPTVDVLERRIAALEGGRSAVAVASGMAAVSFALLCAAEGGGRIIAPKTLYGASVDAMASFFPQFGVHTDFVDDINDLAEVEALIGPDTRAIFAESVANPSTEVTDVAALAELAHRHGVPLIVDNTFPTPINCRPIEFGVDIVTHATTKYMDGHGSCVGGAIVDSGNFDWMAHAEKFPGMTTPDDSYHGVVYAKDFGKAAFITKATAQLMRDFGSTPAPINSWIMGMHLESLGVRMERHCANALATAEFLQADPRISWVSFPGLPSDRYHALAEKYMPNGTCGVIAFGVPGGREKVSAFLDHLKMISIATHVADARSCVLYPAGTTHRQLTEQQLEEAGVGIDLVRLSCGIENAADIIADVKQALDAVLPSNN